MYTKRQIVVYPSKEACKNCNNFSPFEKCPQMMHYQKCTSFEPLDVGDEELVEETRPFMSEALGSAEVKQGKRSIEPPIDEVDAEQGEEEEDAEVE